MRHLVLLFALGVSGGAHADAIDDFVDAELKRQHVPGAAVGIFRNGVPQHARGYGFANLEHRVPVHADTIFQTGSIGKMFTAAAIMLLVEDGKLELDASIRRYLPETPASWQAITVRHLLQHTGGLGDPELDLRRDYSDDELLERYAQVPPVFPAGRRWSYSNPGYVTLGILVGKASGKHYGDFLRERVFLPLGMSTARVISDSDVIADRAAGYERSGDGVKNQSWVSPTLNATADGALYMTLLDYARWDAAVARRSLLLPASWEQILSAARLDNGTTYPYGFGWQLAQAADGQAQIGHSGTWQGFRTEMRRYDRDGVTFVVLANSGDADVSRILRGVAERHDPRYQKPVQRMNPASRPALDRELGQSVQRIRRGQVRDADFPSAGPLWRAWWLDRLRTVFDEAGDCGTLEAISEQANGDHLERDYRGDCAAHSLEISVEFDADGRVATLYASPLEAD